MPHTVGNITGSLYDLHSLAQHGGNLGENIAFYKGIHQQPPPDVTGLDVFLVDFSYKKELLEAMLKTAASITILDHHISAEEDLRELLNNGDTELYIVDKEFLLFIYDLSYSRQTDRQTGRFLVPLLTDLRPQIDHNSSCSQ